VAREDEKRLMHGLPCCFGMAARGFDVGPAGSTKGVGLALAIPHFWEDVGSCYIAHIRQVGDSHVELDLIEELVAGWLPLFSHHDLIDGQVEGSTWRNGGQGAFEQQAGLGLFLPSEGHPSSGSQEAVFSKGHVPEKSLGAYIALHQLHVLDMQVIGGGSLGSCAK